MNYTPAVMLQAEDRAHRIGQVNSVNCHYLIGEDTLDERVYQKLEMKFAVVSSILDGQKFNLDIQSSITKIGTLETKTNEQKLEDKVQGGMKTIDFYFAKSNQKTPKAALDPVPDSEQPAESHKQQTDAEAVPQPGTANQN